MHDSMVRIVLAALVAEWKAAKPSGSRQIHFQGGYVYNIYHVPATSAQQSTSAGNDFSKHKPYWFHKIQANYRYSNNLKHRFQSDADKYQNSICCQCLQNLAFFLPPSHTT